LLDGKGSKENLFFYRLSKFRAKIYFEKSFYLPGLIS